jgi:hypothetical protein
MLHCLDTQYTVRRFYIAPINIQIIIAFDLGTMKRRTTYEQMNDAALVQWKPVCKYMA